MTPVGSFTIEADHPSLAGHFPGRPVVPGVVLLDHVLMAILGGQQGVAAGLPVVKFTRPVLPGQLVQVASEPASEGQVAFVCTVEGTQVARGSVALRRAA